MNHARKTGAALENAREETAGGVSRYGVNEDGKLVDADGNVVGEFDDEIHIFEP
jgi:hypothetical protein